MDQNDSSQNQNPGLFQNAQTYIILAIIVIAAIVFFSTRGNQNQNEQNNENQTNQEDSSNPNSSEQPGGSPDGQTTSDSTSSNGQNGNVTAEGTLKASDNPVRGNLMVDSESGKIYIRTVRDFSSLLDKPVTLAAQGTLKQFVFLGLSGSTIGADVGGAPDQEPSGDVIFTGTLRTSDSVHGNYRITSGSTRVYLQTVHDYSAWVDSEVTLRATGTLNNFTNASLSK